MDGGLRGRNVHAGGLGSGCLYCGLLRMSGRQNRQHREREDGKVFFHRVLLSSQNAVGRISAGGTNVTPCGVAIGVGRGLRKGEPWPLISHRISMAWSSWVVLWQ